MDEINLLWVIVALLAAILLFSIASEVMPKHYSYTAISPPDTFLEDQLNVYGSRGCVIDSSRRAINSGGIASYELVMRCQKW